MNEIKALQSAPFTTQAVKAAKTAHPALLTSSAKRQQALTSPRLCAQRGQPAPLTNQNNVQKSV